jgi:predicted RNA-binding protein YlxR (DUF448 family)
MAQVKVHHKDDYEVFLQVPPTVDELSHVDPDIAERFNGRGGWIIGLPTQMQLVKELRLLREALQAKT